MISLPELEQFKARYGALTMRPLRIIATLSEQVASYHNIHLDSLLAAALVDMAFRGQGLPESAELYELPLPLAKIWQSPQDVPLWASTDFETIGERISDERYYHRRAIEPTMTKKNLRTTQGRHKEKRTPIPTIANRQIYADCIGNVNEIGRLLLSISSIGKKRHSLGAILHWEIEEIDSFSIMTPERKARRPIPVVAFKNMPLDCTNIAYSPPYWHPYTKTLCVDAGQTIPEGCEL